MTPIEAKRVVTLIMAEIREEYPATHKLIAKAINGAYEDLALWAFETARPQVDTEREAIEAAATYVSVKALAAHGIR